MSHHTAVNPTRPKTLVNAFSDLELAQAVSELLKFRNESLALPIKGVIRASVRELHGSFPTLTESMRLRLITDAIQEEVMVRWMKGREE